MKEMIIWIQTKNFNVKNICNVHIVTGKVNKGKMLGIKSCTICGLKNHCNKTCWNKECNKDSMAGCIKMNCGWSYGSSWQKITGVIKGLFKYKCSSVRKYTTELGNRLEHGIEEEKGFQPGR